MYKSLNSQNCQFSMKYKNKFITTKSCGKSLNAIKNLLCLVIQTKQKQQQTKENFGTIVGLLGKKNMVRPAQMWRHVQHKHSWKKWRFDHFLWLYICIVFRLYSSDQHTIYVSIIYGILINPCKLHVTLLYSIGYSKVGPFFVKLHRLNMIWLSRVIIHTVVASLLYFILSSMLQPRRLINILKYFY